MRAVKTNLPVRQAGMKNIVILFFSLILTLAVFSQISAANPKPTYDATPDMPDSSRGGRVGLKSSDWLYYKSNNDISAYLGKKSSALPTVRYQKGKNYLEFSMIEVSSNDIVSRLGSASVSLETDIKTPNTPTLFYRNIFDGADANYQITNIPFKVKEEITLKKFPISPPASQARALRAGNFQFPINDSISNAKIKNSDLIQNSKLEIQNPYLTFLFSAETSAKPVKQKDGSIAFFGDSGDYLFQLDKPFMVDAKGNRSEEVSIEIVPVGETKLSQGNRSFNFQFPILNFQSIINDITRLPDGQVLKQIPGVFSLFKIQNSNLFQNSKLNHFFKIQNSKLEIEPQEYQILLKADNQWLNDPSRIYPVVIDPTVTHNADANFTGQMNRVADNDSTSSTQLESSYPEATKDPYTVLLLHFNEANGTTAGIKDYASTTRVITANGNASTTNYVTQLGMGNSAAFDGTGDYLSIPDSDDWNFGSGDFSIDFWAKFNTIGVSQQTIYDQTGAGSARVNIYLDLSTGFRFRVMDSGGTNNDFIEGSISGWSTNTWYHLAAIRQANTLTAYKNGVSLGSVAINPTNENLTSLVYIGENSLAPGTQNMNGNLDEFRIIKGRALTPEEIKAAASRRPYAVYTSPVVDAAASMAWSTLNWTEGGVNTGDGETLYDTTSLVAQWNFNNTSGTTATNNAGSCGVSCNGTLTNFDTTSGQDATTTSGWTANSKKWGGGGLMMESAAAADYVSITDPASNVLDPNSADLTIETWIKTSDTSAEIFSNNNANGTACTGNGYYLGIDASGYPVFYLDTNGATAGCDASTTSQFKINDGNWHKVSASVTRGTSAVIYVDGKSAGSDTSVTSYSAITVTGNAFWGGSAGGLDGIIDSSRFYSRALSAAEILSNYNAGNIEIQTRTGATSDPNDGTWEAWKPTTGETQLLSMDSDAANWNAPAQIDGYTKLLLHMDGTDAATSFPNSATTTHTVTANNQAQVDTAQSKFGGGSGLFDGTGDYLSVADSEDWNFGAGDFSIDFWVRFNSTPGQILFLDQINGADYQYVLWNTTRLEFGSFLADVGKAQYFFTWSPPLNNWQHIAMVRNGSSFYIFLNGVSQSLTVGAAVGTNTLVNVANPLTIGDRSTGSFGLNGWLDELRISKGIARWTSNFTPPPRPYGSNVKADNETTLKMEGTGSAKLTLGAPQIDGNTVALWHFEETGTTTGTYLYDETANNNDATTTGTTVVDGIFGKARKFNGTSDYVSNNPPTSLPSGANARTVEAWAKVDSFGSGNTYIYSYGDTDYCTGDIFSIGVTSAGKTYFAGGCDDLTGNATLSSNTWYHLAATYDGTTVKIYVNGTLDNSGAKTLNTTPIVASYIGAIVGGSSKFNGIIDEVKVSNRALSPDEIAETYRMGANHHLTRQVSATDLSAQTKLAFWIAADRPGTGLEAMLGESDYANYELASSTLALSTTTVLYIKGDEIASSTSIKDSSFSGKAITANGNARTSGNGKIGNSVYFDGTGDYLSAPDGDDWVFGTGDFSIEAWVNPTSVGSTLPIVGQRHSSGTQGQVMLSLGGSGSGDYVTMTITSTSDVTLGNYQSTQNVKAGVWTHIAFVRNGSNSKLYVNGTPGQTASTEFGAGSAPNIDDTMNIGRSISTYFNGYIDEVRILKGTALTADQIRQAYEYGLRSHQITIDFGATLQSSDLISNSTDYNFSLTATTSGLSATTSGLYLGDKIIIKENLGGTEYTAQGTVNAINTTTGAITVPSWDTGSTFPASNGYSPNATVFKWQREYFDLTGAATTTRNAITNLTLRPTNNGGGRTIYLDDFRYNTNYLTASSSSAITSSNNRYLQYRTIFSSWDSFVSPYLSAINTLYSSTANMFPPAIGISGGGFLSF